MHHSFRFAANTEDRNRMENRQEFGSELHREEFHLLLGQLRKHLSSEACTPFQF